MRLCTRETTKYAAGLTAAGPGLRLVIVLGSGLDVDLSKSDYIIANWQRRKISLRWQEEMNSYRTPIESNSVGINRNRSI